MQIRKVGQTAHPLQKRISKLQDYIFCHSNMENLTARRNLRKEEEVLVFKKTQAL